MDIDLITAREPECILNIECSFGATYNNGTCIGQNAKAMMEKVQTRFLGHLFSNISTGLRPLQKHTVTASQAKNRLQDIMARLQKSLVDTIKFLSFICWRLMKGHLHNPVFNIH